MLDTLYAAFFRPATYRFSASVSVGIGVLVVLVLALNAAGATQASPGGAFGLIVLFGFGTVLGIYWLAASIGFLAHAMGLSSSENIGLAIARGLWPLLLSGPAIAAGTWSDPLSRLLSLGLVLGTLYTLTQSIRQAYAMSWDQAILCLFITLGISGLALAGLIIWPLMVILGL